jgi:hypothetical protein
MMFCYCGGCDVCGNGMYWDSLDEELCIPEDKEPAGIQIEVQRCDWCRSVMTDSIEMSEADQTICWSCRYDGPPPEDISF